MEVPFIIYVKCNFWIKKSIEFENKKQPLGVELFQEVLVVGVFGVVAEGVVAAVGEDYVVNNRYFKNFACLIEGFSHLCICKTWSRITRGMIVYKDNTGSIQIKSNSHYFFLVKDR